MYNNRIKNFVHSINSPPMRASNNQNNSPKSRQLDSPTKSSSSPLKLLLSPQQTKTLKTEPRQPLFDSPMRKLGSPSEQLTSSTSAFVISKFNFRNVTKISRKVATLPFWDLFLPVRRVQLYKYLSRSWAGSVYNHSLGIHRKRTSAKWPSDLLHHSLQRHLIIRRRQASLFRP